MVGSLTAKEMVRASPTRNLTRPLVNSSLLEAYFLKKDPVTKNTLERGVTRVGAMIC